MPLPTPVLPLENSWGTAIEKGKKAEKDSSQEVNAEVTSAVPLTVRELERRRIVQANLTELLHAETINFSPNTTKIVAESRGALEKLPKFS